MYKLILFVIPAVLLFSSCSLFDPRVPEDPSNSGIVWKDPTSPDIVMENLKAALDGSSMQYIDCFNETFVFYADTNDINEYPTLNFDDWVKIVESDVITQLYTIAPHDTLITAEFLLDLEHPDPAAPTDSATIYREYYIDVVSAMHTPSAGIAEIHLLEKSNGFWYIEEWHDVRLEASIFVTWAVMKAAYR